MDRAVQLTKPESPTGKQDKRRAQKVNNWSQCDVAFGGRRASMAAGGAGLVNGEHDTRVESSRVELQYSYRRRGQPETRL